MSTLEDRSDPLLQELLDAARDTAIAIVDADYRLTWLNRTAEHFFHCSAAAVRGHSVRELPIDNHVAASRFEEAVQRIKAGDCFEYRVKQPGEQGPRYLGMHLSGLWRSGRLVGYLLLARDITRRYRSELRARQEGEHYRHLYEDAPVPYHSLDARARIRHVNPAWLEALGYAEEEVLGRPIHHFLEPDQHRTFDEAFGHFQREGRLSGLELVMRRADGKPLIASLTGCAIHDEEKRFHHSHCILLDITEQKAAVQALRQSEERFSLFMDNLPAAAFILDEKGSLLYANRYLKQHFALEGRREAVALPPAFGQQEKTGGEERGRQNLARVRHRDGSERTYQVYRFFISRQAKPALFGGIAIDVTERERNRRDLELFRFALEKAGDAVYWLTPEAELLYVNEEACRQLGYTRQELLTKHPWDVDPRLTPSTCEEIWDQLKQKGTLRMASTHRRKDGGEFPVEITANHLVCGDEEFNCAVVRDVSEQRRVQKELQQAHKMEALGQLTSGIAHDFNNILASILGFSELSLMQLKSGKGENLKAYLKEIHTAGRRGKALIEQMLRFTRNEIQEQQRLPLQPLLEEITRLARSTLPSSILIEPEIEAEAPPITADPVQIHQALMNLCINARDAMENKGVLRIRLRKTRGLEGTCDSCRCRLHGDWVELQVEDTGHGIPPQIRGRIFEPFFTTKKPGKGTGMGLAVVQSAVHQNHGHVVVESEPGRGSRFRLLFPPARVKADEAEAPPLPEGDHPVRLGKALVVDDEPAVLAVLCALLEHYGLNTTGFHDGKDALAHFQQDPDAYDLVLTDQTMPRMTGVELIQRLHELRPELPVILCTGFSDSVSEENTAEFGITAFLRKPVELGDLRQALAQLAD